MAFKFDKTRSMLDAGLAATIIAFLAVLVNRPSFAPTAYIAMLIALLIAATAISIKREAAKERKMDEVQLASINFGSRWAISVVGVAAMAFLFVTPLQDAVVTWFHTVESNVEARGGRALSAPSSVFLLGMVVAMAINLTAKSGLAAIWTWTKR